MITTPTQSAAMPFVCTEEARQEREKLAQIEARLAEVKADIANGNQFNIRHAALIAYGSVPNALHNSTKI